MSYDFDDENDKSPLKIDIKPVRPDDPDAIDLLLQLAAIMLTDRPGATFTSDVLFTRAMDCGGSELGVTDVDMRRCIDEATWLERNGDLLWLK